MLPVAPLHLLPQQSESTVHVSPRAPQPRTGAGVGAGELGGTVIGGEGIAQSTAQVTSSSPISQLPFPQQ